LAVKKGLGKGLGALFESAGQMSAAGDSGVIEVDIHKIEPNQQQPRVRFDEEALLSLAESMKAFGVIQPLILKAEDGFYSIIAGERRWRAARIAKLPTVPAIVRDYSDGERLQVALIENIQREDLNPIEEALCYKRLSEEYFFTQEDIAAKVGKSRNSVSYALSLLQLDKRVQDFFSEGKLTAGHGRCLTGVRDGEAQFALAQAMADGQMSVREAEELVKRQSEAPVPKAPVPLSDENRRLAYRNAENEIRGILGAGVKIKTGKNNAGKIEIAYDSDDELDRLLGLFKQI